jgi:hypothetical protein
MLLSARSQSPFKKIASLPGNIKHSITYLNYILLCSRLCRWTFSLQLREHLLSSMT